MLFIQCEKLSILISQFFHSRLFVQIGLAPIRFFILVSGNYYKNYMFYIYFL